MTFFYNLALLTLSALLVHWKQHSNILREWLSPTRKRMVEFIKGFLMMCILCVLFQLLVSMIDHSGWALKDSFPAVRILQSVWYDINSVLFEELLFRGVLLYMLIRYLPGNPHKALLFSACCFGIYHWFTQGVIGNLPAMLLVFILTAGMGYVFAYAYYRTGSILLSFGLHLGWNLTDHTLFSTGPYGALILKPHNTVEMSESYALLSFILYLLVIGSTYWMVSRLTPYRITKDDQKK
ncbi:hypothetical protein CLV82_0874 [Zeaxanthinibacter enoshimensis]|uniref:CAAX prenyl protease 2/Lysostaphin resistance protein A-like domain-containing protein n=2 Tax=Zeaxanthinibacter enoshimensis TaxID=392009 RepID=A0A4R6TR95_9FLAO|nr:hypothetical protein CLV82_0874 [Zeaxanthinibacter enoshimensis]